MEQIKAGINSIIRRMIIPYLPPYLKQAPPVRAALTRGLRMTSKALRFRLRHPDTRRDFHAYALVYKPSRYSGISTRAKRGTSNYATGRAEKKQIGSVIVPIIWLVGL